MFTTPLTAKLGLRHPIVLAPMGTVAGGALAAAVSGAGGLGQVGVGYGDAAWLARELDVAGDARVGCGFITWRLDAALLDVALARSPALVTLSFGDPTPFVPAVHAAGVPVAAQVGTAEEARRALDAGVDVLVAHGGEGGGHGLRRRSTLTLVPELADLAGDVPVLAAGGISDGRALAAALVLGAAGVFVGTRFWACAEALVAPGAQARAVASSGDDTIPTTVYDQVRGYPWPSGYTSRVLRSPFVQRWHGRTGLPASLGVEYDRAVAAEDFDIAQVLVGEGIGVIDEVRPAGEVVAALVTEAEQALARAAR